ncbi:MAG: RNA methyltransferase [Planctomycetes bacterium HGW-Planctomycetes-1]|nr:MAG: RNA methyltransferase [Planctomycetes bacterium HGW-Planctomycetes-1]
MNKTKCIEYSPEHTSIWSFPERGNWATHKPSYRGNFAPQIARNIIEMYSQRGETVLDPMVGGGTTLIEAKLLARNATGLDISSKAIETTKEALKFNHPSVSEQLVKNGDARDLSFIDDSCIDLILTHPPYMNIIKYSNDQIDDDLSNIGNMSTFCDEMEKIAKELYRVLKPNKFCAILIGDTRKNRHFVPLAFNVMQRFLKVGFILKEDIVKIQHNCSSTKRWVNKAQNDKFYLIMHEHLFVFRKPVTNENLGKVRYSCLMREK